MRTALFWAIAQLAVVITHRRFGTTYRVPSSRVKNPRLLTLDGGNGKLSRNVCKELALLAA